MVEHNLTAAKESLQPGDLVFWSHKPNGRYMNITHVGIYAGDGMVVDASYSKGKVVYRPCLTTISRYCMADRSKFFDAAGICFPPENRNEGGAIWQKKK